MDIILGTSFIDRIIKGIFPQEKKLLQMHWKPVEILDSASRPKPSRTVQGGEGETEDDGALDKITQVIRVEKGLHKPPMTTERYWLTTEPQISLAYRRTRILPTTVYY